MMRISLTLLFCLLLASAAAPAFAQVRPTPTPTPARPAVPQTPPGTVVPVPESRIALIDTSLFADEKAGIFRFVDAVKALEPEFRARNQELTNLQNRITALAEEIKKLRQAPGNERLIQAKIEEGTRLRQDFDTRKQRLDEDASKRYEDVTAPISEQIGKAMDEFARQRGITMTLDFSKLLPALLTAVPAVDVTQAFIADFNRKNPRTATPPRP